MKLKKSAVIVAAVVAALYVLYLGALFVLQGSIIYPGTRDRVAAAPPHGQDILPLRIETALGTVDALFLPAPAGPAPQPVVIFAHGNGEVIDYWTRALHGFQERGIGVLLVEYPGYGRSTGSPSERAVRLAMDSAYDRIVADPRVDRTRIFAFGQSLGGGAVCLLALDRPLRALILQSTFTSLDRFALRFGAPAFVLSDHYDNLSTVRNFGRPVLVISGSKDDLIPWQQGRQLAAAASHATFRLYDCGHVCWDPEHVPFWKDATVFLQDAGILPRGPNGAAE